MCLKYIGTQTVFSFEVFSPKKTSNIDTVYRTLEELEGLTPDFISVTLSAGGSGNSVLALDIASKIKEGNKVEPMIHLPCINYSKTEIESVLTELNAKGIENILALRGDINPNIPPKNKFRYAGDLVSFIKEHGNYDIAGADYLISQLFYDNDMFKISTKRLNFQALTSL